MAKILIIGCGDVGGALAENLLRDGHEVTGLKRTLPSYQLDVSYIKADITKMGELANVPLDYDQVIYILSPSSRLISAYEDVFKLGVDNVLERFKNQKQKVSFTFVSSSRVYGQNKGERLNETSETEPTDERGIILLKAENKFRDFNGQTTIVRFSGIYGRSNYSLYSKGISLIEAKGKSFSLNSALNQLKKGTEIQKEPPYYTNRIHRSDCVGVLRFITNRKSEGKSMQGIYVASDNDPASKWDIANFLVDMFGANKPRTLILSENAAQNKRLDNKRLLQEGYEFKYNSYKEGYKGSVDE